MERMEEDSAQHNGSDRQTAATVEGTAKWRRDNPAVPPSPGPRRQWESSGVASGQGHPPAFRLVQQAAEGPVDHERSSGEERKLTCQSQSVAPCPKSAYFVHQTDGGLCDCNGFVQVNGTYLVSYCKYMTLMNGRETSRTSQWHAGRFPRRPLCAHPFPPAPIGSAFIESALAVVPARLLPPPAHTLTLPPPREKTRGSAFTPPQHYLPSYAPFLRPLPPLFPSLLPPPPSLTPRRRRHVLWSNAVWQLLALWRPRRDDHPRGGTSVWGSRGGAGVWRPRGGRLWRPRRRHRRPLWRARRGGGGARRRAAAAVPL